MNRIELTAALAMGQRMTMRSRAFVTAVASLCVLPTLWPADAPFIYDEPRLILSALQHNAAHQIATLGLEGTRGVHYGPLPIWVYQALLLVSHHLPTLVVLHALGMMIATAIGLVLLARALGLPAILVLLPLASPYLWFYARDLWDNTLLIPLACLSAGAYGWFLRERQRGFLFLGLGCAALMPLVHLMALAWVVPLAMHALWFARRELRRSIGALAALGALWLVGAWPYLHELATAPSKPALSPPYAYAWLFPFSGPRVLTALGLDRFYQKSWASLLSGALWLDAARILTVTLFFAGWGGMALAAAELLKRPWTARTQLLALLLMALLAQIGLDTLAKVGGQPHYFNATWPIFAGFAWLGCAQIMAVRPFRGLPVALLASLLVVLVALIVGLHRAGGTRGWGYGPTLGSQILIARQLERYPPDVPLSTTVQNFHLFPQELRVLKRLEPPAGSPLSARRLRIDYAGAGAHLVLHAE